MNNTFENRDYLSDPFESSFSASADEAACAFLAELHETTPMPYQYSKAYLIRPELQPPLGAPLEAPRPNLEQQQVEARMQELSRQYGIVFGRPGEQLTYQGATYTNRLPTLAELDCLGEVLRKNGHMNFQNMRICFLEGTNRDYLGAYQATGNDGHPQMLIMPNNTLQGWNALEGTLQHELVHHEQFAHFGSVVWGTSQATGAVLDALGWRYDPSTGKYRLLDRDGVHYERQKIGDEYRWVPIINGQPRPDQSITNEQMRERALVKPATGYFTYPWEMHAEALAMFRHDRARLWAENPALYELMKRFDQEALNQRYGFDNGRPRMIRAANGEIVLNTQANRDAVAAFEQQMRDAPARPHNNRRDMEQRAFKCACCAGGL